MHFTVCRVVCFTLLGILAILGVVGIFEVPKLIDNIAHGQAALIENSEAAANFEKLPVLLYQRFYMFNITNYDAFMGGDLPTVEEKGPYTFRTEWVKNMSWTDNNILMFRENRKFWFEEEMSKPNSLDDEIYAIDPVLLVAIEKIDKIKIPKFFKWLIKTIILAREVLAKHKVRELLYEGYPDTLAKYAHFFDSDLPVIDGKVGFLLGQNDTDDGEFKVYTGEGKDIDRLNSIIDWRGSPNISYYGGNCSRLWGTNGEMFAPFSDPPKTLSMFNSLLCRPWDLYYNKTDKYNGVSMAEYSSGSGMFSFDKDPVVDKCYQPRGVNLTGVFDASACQKGFPVLLSLPHFYKADPKTRSDVNGMSPDPKKHDFTLSVYPQLGFVTGLQVRLQLNFKTSAKPKSTSSKYPEVIFPVFWQELIMLDKDRDFLSDLVYDKVEMPKIIARGVCIGLVVLATIIFILSVVLLSIKDSKANRMKPTTTDRNGLIRTRIDTSGHDEIDRDM